MGCCLAASLKRTIIPTYGVVSGFELPVIAVVVLQNMGRVIIAVRITMVMAKVFLIVYPLKHY